MAADGSLGLVFVTNKNPYGAESYGGAEASCRLLAERMSERGHESAYFTHRVLPDHAAAAAANAVALRGLPSRNSVTTWRPARPWRTAASLVPHLVHHRVDVAYCFYEPNILRSLFIARRLAPRVRVVMQMAGQHWYESSLRNPRNFRRYARLFSQVDCVNYVDAKLEEVTRQRLEELGIAYPFRRSFTGEIGSAAGFGRMAGPEPRNGEPFRLVMAARFATFSRRQDLLIEMMSLLPEGAPIQLTLIGDGARRRECERMVEDRELSDRVTFRPFLPQPELWDLFSRAHLLTHCADHEGLGKVIIEAMAQGLPVLASDVQVINGYIEDGGNGFLAPNDAHAWARRVLELKELPELRWQVAERAQDFARAHHSPERNVVLYEEEFGRLVGRRAA